MAAMCGHPIVHTQQLPHLGLNSATKTANPDLGRAPESKLEAEPMSYASTLRATNLNLALRFTDTVKAVRAALQRRRVFNQTVRELSQLSSRDLADLGIHRSMITRIALESAYGK